jgi:putative ABC transport system permease protein
MKRFLYELSESWKIAVAQMRSNITRSTLTALGVIIGIVAVTLMGTAIGGIQIGFDKSMAIFGDDILYVGQWPWKNVDDWWNYRDRKKIKTEYAEGLNRMIAMTLIPIWPSHSDIQCLPQRQIHGQRSEQCSDPRHRVGLYHHIDI